MAINPVVLKLSANERQLADMYEIEIDAEILRQNDKLHNELHGRKESLTALGIKDTDMSTSPETQCFEIVLQNRDASSIVYDELIRRYTECGWTTLRFGVTDSKVTLWAVK